LLHQLKGQERGISGKIPLFHWKKGGANSKLRWHQEERGESFEAQQAEERKLAQGRKKPIWLGLGPKDRRVRERGKNERETYVGKGILVKSVLSWAKVKGGADDRQVQKETNGRGESSKRSKGE